MAGIKFVGFWAKQWQEKYKVPKGFILIKLNENYIKNLSRLLNNLHDFQNKKKGLRELDILLEYHYKKRTLDQNRLLWALYNIESNEMNAGMQGEKSQMMTPEELYRTDLESYAPRMEVKIQSENLSFLKSEYKIEKEEPIKDDQGNIKYYKILVVITTSHFTTIQMATWIDRIFNRMAVNGVTCTNPADIKDYWLKWRQSLNDEKIMLHDDLLTASEYKSLNPICEATGDFIGNNTGQLCHIKARGMGGNPEEEKDYTSNWLHLSAEAHLAVQHQKGWSHFLKLYPHLKYKVETALRREYPEYKEGEELFKKDNK